MSISLWTHLYDYKDLNNSAQCRFSELRCPIVVNAPYPILHVICIYLSGRTVNLLNHLQLTGLVS